MTSSQAITSSRCANASGTRGLFLASLALVAAAAPGCVPFPVTPGPFPDSRTNVPAEVPPTIATGHTTRREVLFELGEPDGLGPGDRWYSYGSAISHGGVGGLFPTRSDIAALTRESVEFRRLLVRFDAAGVVSDVRIDTKHCPFWYGPGMAGASGPNASIPCLDIRGGEIESRTLKEPAAAAGSVAGEAVLSHFKNVIRRAGDCPVHSTPHIHEADYPGELQILPDALLFVLPARRQMQRSAFIEHPEVLTRVPLAQIESVEPIKGPWVWAWVNVHMTDGSCSSVQFTGYRRAQEAAQLIRGRIRGE